MEVLQPMIEHKAYNIIQLIYRAKTYEGPSKDYEFSRRRSIGAPATTMHYALCVTLRC
jgi:Patatin phospholipase